MANREFGLTAFAKKTPDKDAIIYQETRVTYRDLNQRVNRLARGLQSMGMGDFDKIALLSYNRPEFIEVSQACTKIKAVAVPLNYRLKENEIEYVLGDSESKVLILDHALSDRIQRIRDRLPDIRSDHYIVIGGKAEGMVPYEEFLGRFSDEEPEVEDPDVLGRSMRYTSGTTGLPKGVFRQQPITKLIVHMIREFDVRHEDIHIVACPLYHSAPITAVNWTMLVGGTIVIMPRFDARVCLELIQKEKVNTTFMAPIIFRYIFDLPREELAKHDVRSMRVIVIAGAPCPFEIKKEICEYFGPNVLYEYYGSTDGGMNTILKPPDQLRKPNSIGQLFPENEILIVDEADNPLPPNRVGEILVFNPYLLDEYHNDPEFTKKSFMGKYWRSGDLGYVDEEGYYYVVDRAKDMIISGGVNIYPVEIENTLLSHPKVFDCAVIGVPDRTYGEAVKAVVQLKEGQRATEEEIIQWVGERLADYKKPKSVDFPESLPRDMTGKIMKRYLREQYWAGEKKKV